MAKKSLKKEFKKIEVKPKKVEVVACGCEEKIEKIVHFLNMNVNIRNIGGDIFTSKLEI